MTNEEKLIRNEENNNENNTSYVDGIELLDEDFQKLDEYLDTKFIPECITLEEKENVDGEIEYYQAINLRNINDLNLSDYEFEHVMDYLRSHNIEVSKKEIDIEEEFSSNYEKPNKEKYPQVVPSKVTEEKLKKYKENKDKKLREEIFFDNMQLVPYYAKQFSKYTGIDQEELESYGYEGLLYAMDTHDESYKDKFIAYATKCIRAKIASNIGKKEKSSYDRFYFPYVIANHEVEQDRLFAHESMDNKHQEKVDRMFESEEKKKNPFQNPREEFYNNYEYYKYDVGERIKVYQDEMRSYSDEDELENMLNSGELKDPYDFTDKSNNYELNETMDKMLETIEPQEREILKTRFGFIDGRTKTLEETGKIVGLDPHQVRRIENYGIRRLRHPNRARYLYDFYSDYTNDYYDKKNEIGLKIAREEKENQRKAK